MGQTTTGGLLRALRRRADEDFLEPRADAAHEPGRHTTELPELGLRVSLTRSRYPNRPEGADLYAMTISRIGVDGPPAEEAVTLALEVAFGDGARTALARPSGPAVRMFRVRADAASPAGRD